MDLHTEERWLWSKGRQEAMLKTVSKTSLSITEVQTRADQSFPLE